jgi:hypothetical protein
MAFLKEENDIVDVKAAFWKKNVLPPMKAH